MKRWMKILIKDLGTPLLLEHEEFSNGYPVYSGVFVCPICLTPWAALEWLGPDFQIIRASSREVRGLLCSSCFQEHGTRFLHPDISPVAGSILHNPTLNNWDQALLNELPEVLVRREFELTMSSLLKEFT